MMSSKRSLLLIVTLALVLAACGATPEPQTIIETVEVEKEVPVEVTSIVEVEKEVPVEVTSIVEVEKEVPVEVTSVVEVPVEKSVVTVAGGTYLTTSFAEGYPSPWDAIKAAVAEKYPDIELTLNRMPDTMGGRHDSLVTWLTAEDDTIDIMGIDGPWIPEFGQAGWLAPLNDALPAEVLDQLDPGYLSTYSYQGDILAIPVWGSIGTLYYRKDLLDEYGFEPPETYDDLVMIAETILADHPEMIGFAWQGMKDEALICDFSEFYLGFGGQFFDDAGKCTMNSPEGVAALEYMVNLIDSGISPKEVTSWKEAECEDQFSQGRAIFSRTWSSTSHWLDDPERSQVVGKWGLISNPAQPGADHANVVGGNAMAMSKYTDVPDAALKVLEVIAGFDVQKAYTMAWGPLQPHMDLTSDTEVIENVPELPMVQGLFSNAVGRVAVPGANYFQGSDIIQDEVHSAITGGKTAQEALDDACERLDQLTQQ